MHVLVLDESGVMPWLVAHLGGPGIEVVAVDDFEEALAMVRRGSIDAAVVSATPAQMPWQEFQRACTARRPPVPVLYESCVASGVEEIGLCPGEGHALFLRKPASRSTLAEALARLLAVAVSPEGANAPSGGARPGHQTAS